MSPEEIRAWAAIVISALALIAVSVIGGRAAWKNSRKSAEEQEAAKKEPSWHELVTENRNLRTDLGDLDAKFEAYREEQRQKFEEHQAETRRKTAETDGEIRLMKANQSLADRREVLIYHHTKALRDHIINEMPPPPPPMPKELSDWFENFEDTQPTF